MARSLPCGLRLWLLALRSAYSSCVAAGLRHRRLSRGRRLHGSRVDKSQKHCGGVGASLVGGTKRRRSRCVRAWCVRACVRACVCACVRPNQGVPPSMLDALVRTHTHMLDARSSKPVALAAAEPCRPAAHGAPRLCARARRPSGHRAERGPLAAPPCSLFEAQADR